MNNFNNKEQDLPLISIVTVVYNDVYNIENTIKSVVLQSYINIEYIIVDGGSSDGTVNIINNYKKHIAEFISEPDKGIYDAMNKGTNLATGEWIIYMNSGDVFYDLNILNKIYKKNFNKINSASVIYSDVLSKNIDDVKRIFARSLNLIWMGPPASHQCQFVKTVLAKSKPFNLDFKVNADYDFIYYIYKKKLNFVYLKEICIAICDASEGLSKASNPKMILKENFIVSKQYSNFLQLQFLFCINILKFIYSNVRKFKL